MDFRPGIDLIRLAAAEGYAVPSFCVWNAETMVAVLSVAADLHSPVMLMNGPAEILALVAGRSGRGRPRRRAAIQRAHRAASRSRRVARSRADVSRGRLYLGNARLFLPNVRGERGRASGSRPVGPPRGATVEGEIGHVGKADASATEGGAISTLTDPAEAAAYAKETGVDLLAVSIGNAHGHYTRLPKFDFPRLEAIRAAVGVPLVLHGGSGTAPEDLKQVISLGIAKVNVATELVAAMRESLMAQWQSGRNLWAPLAQAAAMKAMLPVIEKWIRLTGAAGRA